MRFGLSETDIGEIVDTIKKFPEIERVVIFGSRVIGSYKPASDIDLALIGNISFDLVTQLTSVLEEELNLPYMFDIIDYKSANPDLKKHIDDYGVSFTS